MSGEPAAKRPLRKDAVRNRERVLEAANQLVTERGLDIALEDIARQAGVGVATVYRHFDGKPAVLQALFDRRIDQIVAIVERALAGPEAYEAFRDCLFALGEVQSTDRGIWQAMATSDDPALKTRRRERIAPVMNELVLRAKATGRLRPDLAPTDVPMIIWTLGALASRLEVANAGVWRRYLQIVLDGMSAADEPRTALPEPALTRPDLARFMGAETSPDDHDEPTAQSGQNER